MIDHFDLCRPFLFLSPSSSYSANSSLSQFSVNLGKCVSAVAKANPFLLLMWCLHMANLLQFASQSSTVAADNILIDISYDFNFNLVPLIVSLFAVFARNSLTSVSPLPQDKTGLVAFSFHCYDKCSCPLRWSVLAVVTKVDLSSSIAIVFSPDLHCVFALISPIIMLIVLFQCFCTIYISGQCCLQAGPMTLSLSRWDSEFPRCTL